MDKEFIDEILERIWIMEEKGIIDLKEIAKRFPRFFAEKSPEEIVSMGLVEIKNGKIFLTQKGRVRAKGIIRKHRIAERLLKDVLNMEEPQSEEEACTFEHNITPGIVDSICTLLGHPRECPHGQPIPEGECCRQAKASLESIVTNLSNLRVGERGIVSYINTRNYGRIKKLYSFGFVPGVEIEVVQKAPAFVVKIEETQIALETEVAEDVFVRRTENHLS